MPLTMTCVECDATFIYPALEKHIQTGRCPSCQLDYEIAEAQDDMALLSTKMCSIYPALQHLKDEKELAEIAYNEARDAWSKMARLYEKMNRKKAQIQHDLDIKVGKKKVTTGKSRKARKGKNAKSAAELALAALNNLDEETRAAVLAQMNNS